MGTEIGHNEEVTWKSHLAHDVEFIVQTCAMFVSNSISKSINKSPFGFATKPRVFSLTDGNLKLRKEIFAFA